MITQRLGQLPELLGITIAEFERELGMSGGVLRKALIKKSHVSSKWIVVASEKFPISGNWIVTGEGEPLLSNDPFSKGEVKELDSLYKIMTISGEHELPLISQNDLLDYDPSMNVSEFTTYKIPDFSRGNGHILVRINEDSMQPKYKSGSLFISKMIEDTNVIQWGKIFVLCTSSGIMLRRLLPSDQGEAFVSCIADNKDYPSFDLKLNEIAKLFMVVGAISFE